MKNIPLEAIVKEGDNALSVNGKWIRLDDSLYDAVPYQSNDGEPVLDLRYRTYKDTTPESNEEFICDEAGEIHNLLEEMGLERGILVSPCAPYEEKPYSNIAIVGNISAKVHKSGRAYAFFDCNASKDEIESELPSIQETVQTPRGLNLSIETNNRLFPLNPNLSEIARESQEAGMKYVMEATYPNAENKQTADELAGILNQAYQSPLYQEGEQFRGEIVYEDNGRLVFRE